MEAPQREELARLAGTSVAHLYQVAGGHSKASPELVSRIERAAGVTLADFRNEPR